MCYTFDRTNYMHALGDRANLDQHEFSPVKICTLSTRQVKRKKKIINQEVLC